MRLRITVSTSGSSGTVHQNIVALYLDRICLDASVGVEVIASGCAVKLPAVPGARNIISIDRAKAKRTTQMRTYPPERVDFTGGVTEGERKRADGDLDNGVRRKLR